mgnify:CR=1 FL=1
MTVHSKCARRYWCGPVQLLLSGAMLGTNQHSFERYLIQALVWLITWILVCVVFRNHTVRRTHATQSALTPGTARHTARSHNTKQVSSYETPGSAGSTALPPPQPSQSHSTPWLNSRSWRLARGAMRRRSRLSTSLELPESVGGRYGGTVGGG